MENLRLADLNPTAWRSRKSKGGPQAGVLHSSNMYLQWNFMAMYRVIIISKSWLLTDGARATSVCLQLNRRIRCQIVRRSCFWINDVVFMHMERPRFYPRKVVAENPSFCTQVASQVKSHYVQHRFLQSYIGLEYPWRSMPIQNTPMQEPIHRSCQLSTDMRAWGRRVTGSWFWRQDVLVQVSGLRSQEGYPTAELLIEIRNDVELWLWYVHFSQLQSWAMRYI